MAFGHKFVGQHGNVDNGVWWEALSDLTRKDVEDGFRKMLRDTQSFKPGEPIWPPNVKEFRAYCVKRLEDFGLPENHVAYNQVYDARVLGVMYCDHAAVYQAAIWMGYDTLITYSPHTQSEYIRVYDMLCQALMRGLELPRIKKAIWEKGKLPNPLPDLQETTLRGAIIDLSMQHYLKGKHNDAYTTAVK